MPTNDFLPFATAGGANVQTQAEYAGEAARLAGVIAGTAKSALANKSWRQSAAVSAMVGQFIADHSGLDALDDGDIAALLDRFEIALRRGDLNYRLAAGTANALTITLDPAPTDWTDLVNVPLLVRFAALNNDAANLAVTGASGTKLITMPGGKYPCPLGTLRPGAVGILMYNGTSVEYLNAPAPAATNFFVNQATGSDSNLGSAAAPLASILEAMRRTPVGGICNIGMLADYQHDQITRLNGRRLNIQGYNSAGTVSGTQRAFAFSPTPIAAGLQDPIFTGAGTYPNNTSSLILGAGDSLQFNTMAFNRAVVSGPTQVWSGHFMSDGLASLDMVNCVLNSPVSGVNTTWFIAALNRLSLSLNISGLSGDNAGKIYSNVVGGVPLAAGNDPNSLWNFMCNLTSS